MVTFRDRSANPYSQDFPWDPTLAKPPCAKDVRLVFPPFEPPCLDPERTIITTWNNEDTYANDTLARIDVGDDGAATFYLSGSNMLQKTTKRQIMAQQHYQFKQRLLNQAKLCSCQVHVVTEEYTSKTCGVCGELVRVGGSKCFKCSCGLSLDRDFNGARNILLKYMTEAGVSVTH